MILENIVLSYLLNNTKIEDCPRDPELGCIIILKEDEQPKPYRGSGRLNNGKTTEW